MYLRSSLSEVKVTQLCLTLCDPVDYTVCGILRARILEILQIIQPFPSPGALPDPGIEPRSPTLQADSLLAELPEKPKKQLRSTPIILITILIY